MNVGFDVIDPLEATVKRSLIVEGGSDGNIISKFDGPIVLNNKLHLLLLKVLRQHHYFYRVIEMYLESIQLVLLHLHFQVMLVM